VPPAGPISTAHQTFASLAEQEIRDMVLDGRLPQGSRINEVQLAAELEISRGPLREALQRLASQGLLTMRSHRGAFVTVVDVDELRHLYGLRVALEVFAVRSTVGQADASQISHLAELLSVTEKLLGDQDASDYPVHGDLDFHRQLVAACANPALIEVHERTLQRIGLARFSSAHQPERSRAALEEHESILTAVSDGDEALAAATLESHLWKSLRSAATALASSASTTE
jgi:DNA-binding GntR family transcriptional regulator